MNEFKIGDEVEVINYLRLHGKKAIISDISKDGLFTIKIENKIYPGFQYYELKPLTPKPFTKDDLKKLEGAKIELRNGLLGFYHSGGILGWSDTFPLHIDNFNDDFTYFGDKKIDIMKVTLNDKVLFEREEKPFEFYMKYHYCDTNQVIDDISKIDFKNMVVEIRIKEVTECNTK